MANSSPHRFGKNDGRYWRSKIFRLVNPRGVEVAHYSVRIQWHGRRHYFALGTANKEAAAAKAADVYRDLASLGLETTLAKHKLQAPQPLIIVSIGDWLAATERVFTRRPVTFGDYARSLRLIASEILAASKGRRRFGRSGSRDYRKAIEEAPLSVLSANAVREWQIRRVLWLRAIRQESVQQRSQPTHSWQARSLSHPGSSSFSIRRLYQRSCRYAVWNSFRGSRCDTRASSTLPSLCNVLSRSLPPSH